MKTYVSMLRGINVSGQKKIKMHELKTLYQSLDLKEVKTYIQSGNIVFRCPNTNSKELKKEIERKIKESFGFNIAVLIRTKDEFERVIERNPFLKKDITKLHVTFLSDYQKKVPIKDINSVKEKSEEFSISGSEIYLFCPNGYGKSKLSNNFFEKKLNVSATTRNWKTVNKLLSIAGSI